MMNRLRRRAGTVSTLVVVTCVATISAPIWISLLLVVDLLTAPRQRPYTRLALFGWAWCLIECAGVLGAFGLWLTGQGRNHALHYRLMGWWAGRLMGFMSRSLRLSMKVEGEEALEGGRLIVLCRHASLADSLVSAWVMCTNAGLWTRYVLKKELILDPCLDVVGLRVPNHFVDRGAADSASDLVALRSLSSDLDERSVAVIFPEGTRSSEAKRQRAIESISQRDPDRVPRVRDLTRLLPIRPSGALALMEGAPDADLVFAWHTGFDGLDTFSGILSMLRHGGDPGRFVMRRVQRSEVPVDVVPWLDEQWARMDGEIALALGEGS